MRVEAVEYFKRAVELDGENVQYRIMYARGLEKIGLYKEAVAEFKQVLSELQSEDVLKHSLFRSISTELKRLQEQSP